MINRGLKEAGGEKSEGGVGVFYRVSQHGWNPQGRKVFQSELKLVALLLLQQGIYHIDRVGGMH